jgi:predicted GTPase
MDYTIDILYSQFIKPLSNNERMIIVQRILQDFINEQKKEDFAKDDKLKKIRKFRAIANISNIEINKEDWYLQ